MHPGYWKNHPTAFRHQGGSGVTGAQRMLALAAERDRLNNLGCPL